MELSPSAFQPLQTPLFTALFSEQFQSVFRVISEQFDNDLIDLLIERRISGRYIQSDRIDRCRHVGDLPRIATDAAAHAVQVALRL